MEQKKEGVWNILDVEPIQYEKTDYLYWYNQKCNCEFLKNVVAPITDKDRLIELYQDTKCFSCEKEKELSFYKGENGKPKQELKTEQDFVELKEYFEVE